MYADQYTGPLQSTQGEIAYVENIPAEEVLEGTASGSSLTVENLFVRATKTINLAKDTYELVYRPDVAHPAQWVNWAAGGAYAGGTPPSSGSYVTSNQNAIRPRYFGFAFRGVTPAIIESFSLDFFKVVEWRPNSGTGIPGRIPRGVSEHPNPAAKALTFLDQHFPGWSAKIVPVGLNLATRAAQLVFTGT